VLRVRSAGIRPRRHRDQPHLPHQALDPLTVDGVAHRLEEDDHLAAAKERVTGVFLVDQAAEQEVAFIDRPDLLPRIDRGAGNARQSTLLDQGYFVPVADPRLPGHDRLIPDFFF